MTSIFVGQVRAVVLVCFIGLAGCLTEAPAQSPPGSDWDEYVRGFLDSYFHNNPVFAVTLGRHEFDGRLPTGARGGSRHGRPSFILSATS